jgi:hypothetical protein
MSLKQLGIPNTFVGAIRAILESTHFTIKVAGWRRQFFCSTATVPQGQPTQSHAVWHFI